MPDQEAVATWRASTSRPSCSLRSTIPSPPHPTQALRLGLLPGRELPSPPGMLGSLPSHRPTLGSDALMHPRDLQLDLGDRLGQLGDLLPERSALRPLLLDAQEQIRPAQARIGRHKNPIPTAPPQVPTPAGPAIIRYRRAITLAMPGRLRMARTGFPLTPGSRRRGSVGGRPRYGGRAACPPAPSDSPSLATHEGARRPARCVGTSARLAAAPCTPFLRLPPDGGRPYAHRRRMPSSVLHSEPAPDEPVRNGSK